MLFSYPSSTAVGDRTPGWAGPCSDSTGPLSSPGLGSLLAADNNLITDKVKPLPFKGSPDLWWPWQGTARFRAVPCPRMRQWGGQECLMCVSTCTYTVTQNERRSLITQSPFLTASTCFDLSISNINTEQSTDLDRHPPLKPCTAPCPGRERDSEWHKAAVCYIPASTLCMWWQKAQCKDP